MINTILEIYIIPVQSIMVTPENFIVDKSPLIIYNQWSLNWVS